jgi:MoaA/NifB/PqqE/SkfB family radical SAM enzyme
MVRDIYEIIRYISAENDLVLLTNGMFFNDSNVAKLRESVGRGNISFQVSLDGPTAELHNAIRGKHAFEKAIAGAKRLIDSGYDVAISTATTAPP